MGGACSSEDGREDTQRSRPISEYSMRQDTLQLAVPSIESDLPGLDAASVMSDGEIKIGKEVSIEVPTGKYKGRTLTGIVLRSEPGNIDYYWVRIQEDELSRKTKTAENVMRVHHKRIISHIHNPTGDTCRKNNEHSINQSKLVSREQTGREKPTEGGPGGRTRSNDTDNSTETSGPGNAPAAGREHPPNKSVAERMPTGRVVPDGVHADSDLDTPRSSVTQMTADAESPGDTRDQDNRIGGDAEHGVEVPLPPDNTPDRTNESDALT